MMYDVAIIGAGPCGLAVAARLRESTPSALFTDSEHARYWQRFNRRQTLESELKRKQSVDSGYESLSEGPSQDRQKRLSMVVFDAKSDQWLAQWKERFSNLKITHLRSPLFFHPDPRDRDGLLAYAYEQGREKELDEIENVVGKELSKHEKKKQQRRRPQKKVVKHLQVDGRDRVDYFTPTTELFNDYCSDVIKRYDLESVVKKAQIYSIKYDDFGLRTEGSLFSINTDVETHLAKIVILAIGPGASPAIPKDCNLKVQSDTSKYVSHCFEPKALKMPDHIQAKIRSKQTTNIVVIGGGLTSAQVADLLIRQGVTKVWLLLRSKYKIKHFDVDLEWVSKCRNQRMATFWSAETDEERLEMLKVAKNGGSITPRFDRILQRHSERGRLNIHTQTRIEDGEWCSQRQKWILKTDSPVSDLLGIDHIIFETGGGQPGLQSVACLQDLYHENPIKTVEGLPKVNDDLMWDDDIPVFFTGALAALRLGPGAANLAGARQGAERIAWKVEQLLVMGKSDLSVDEHDQSNPEPASLGRTTSAPKSNNSSSLKFGMKERSEFTGGFSNQFQALTVADSQNE